LLTADFVDHLLSLVTGHFIISFFGIRSAERGKKDFHPTA